MTLSSFHPPNGVIFHIPTYKSNFTTPQNQPKSVRNWIIYPPLFILSFSNKSLHYKKAIIKLFMGVFIAPVFIFYSEEKCKNNFFTSTIYLLWLRFYFKLIFMLGLGFDLVGELLFFYWNLLLVRHFFVLFFQIWRKIVSPWIYQV